MARRHRLLVEADRLRATENAATNQYLTVLQRIEVTTQIWKATYKTFKHFLLATDHGPYERYERFKEVHEVCREFDTQSLQKTNGRGKATPCLDLIGFEAAAQALLVTDPVRRLRVLDLMLRQASEDGKPLTYQAGVILVKRVLGNDYPSRPSARTTLLEENSRLKDKIAAQLRTISILRKILKDNNISDPTQTKSNQK